MSSDAPTYVITVRSEGQYIVRAHTEADAAEYAIDTFYSDVLDREAVATVVETYPAGHPAPPNPTIDLSV